MNLLLSSESVSMVRAIADGRSRRRHRAELRGGGLETLQDVPAEAGGLEAYNIAHLESQPGTIILDNLCRFDVFHRVLGCS